MKRRTPTSSALLLPLCGIVACSSPAPPYADLTLRDALGADPSIIAALPAAEQATIAEHFEQQRAAETDEDGIALAGPSTPQEVLRAMDESRRAAGDDALVVAQLRATGGALGAKALAGTVGEANAPIALPRAMASRRPTRKTPRRALSTARPGRSSARCSARRGPSASSG